MIVTITLNPAVDCTTGIASYHENAVNRAEYQYLTAGGKGINISAVLQRLGIDTVAFCFCGGETGRLFCTLLDKIDLPYSVVWLKNQSTRINFKLKCGDSETEINGKGAEIPPAILEKFISELDGELKDGDTLVLAGSIPDSVSHDVYARIIKSLAHRDIRIVADSSGKPLTEILPLRPFLIKPNNFELGEILGCDIATPFQALKGAYRLQEIGARNVLVSLAGKGAVLLTENGMEYMIDAPTGKVKSSVGAGDSMLAGFLAGLEKSGDFYTALRLGTASGSATAFSDGLATRAEIDELFKRI